MSVVKTYLSSAFQIVLVFNGNFEIGFNVWSCFFGYVENIALQLHLFYCLIH